MNPMPRFQFSLKTLFVAVTLLAIVCGYAAKTAHDRAALREKIHEVLREVVFE